jgi:hypothetical protein
VEPERFIEAPTLGPNVTARATPSVTAPPARPGRTPPFWCGAPWARPYKSAIQDPIYYGECQGC